MMLNEVLDAARFEIRSARTGPELIGKTLGAFLGGSLLLVVMLVAMLWPGDLDFLE